MLGRSFISLTSIIFCFFRASFFFFCSSYLNLPKSRILHTGGSAPGAISTRSRPAFKAMVSASLRPTTPTMLPRSSTRRTFIAPISSLMRGPSRVGVIFIGGLGMYALLSLVEHSRLGSTRQLRLAGRGCLILQSSNGVAQRKGFLRRAAEPAQRDGTLLRLAPADDEHQRDLGQAVLAHLVADLLVAGIGDDAQPGGAH